MLFTILCVNAESKTYLFVKEKHNGIPLVFLLFFVLFAFFITQPNKKILLFKSMQPTPKPITCKIASTLYDALRLKLSTNAPTCDEPLHLEYFVYFLAKITTIPLTNNKYKNLQKVPVSSVILRNEMGKNYKRYIEYLLEYGFIETDNHYVVGDDITDGKCKCYSISKKYCNSKMININISNKFLLSKILKWKMKKFGKESSDPLVSKIYKMIEEFEIDISGATKYLEELVRKKVITRKVMMCELDKCRRINEKDSNALEHFVIKDKYNRVHTNFTNLSKHIRENFLYINGKKVVSLDIQTCQPALLYTLFNNYCNMVDAMSDKSLYNITDFERTDCREKYVNRNNIYEGMPNFDSQVNFEYNTFGLSPQQFVSKIKVELGCYERGLYNDIYDFFSDRWEYFYGESRGRSKVKKDWIAYVFGKDVTEYTMRIHYIWNHYFPLLTKLLAHFKKDDHRTLARSLQKNESSIMFDKVFPLLEQTIGTFTTVHDCILVSPDDIEQASTIFESVLRKNNVVTDISITT